MAVSKSGINNILIPQEGEELKQWFTTEIIEKLSEKEISFNKRILEAKGQLLCYYSSIPSSFAEKRELKPETIPKQGIQFANIIKVEGDDPQTWKQHRPNVFSITFNKRYLIDFKSNQKDSLKMKEKLRIQYVPEIDLDTMKPRNKIEESNYIQWIFQCQNQEQRYYWIQRISYLSKYFKEKLFSPLTSQSSKQKDIRNGSNSMSFNGNNNNNKDKMRQQLPLQQQQQQQQLDRIDEEEYKNNLVSYSSNQNAKRLDTPMNTLQDDEEDNLSEIPSPTKHNRKADNQEKRLDSRQKSINGYDSLITNNVSQQSDHSFDYKQRESETIKCIAQEEERIERERKEKEEQSQEKLRMQLKIEEENNKMKNKQIYDNAYELRYSDQICGEGQLLTQLQKVKKSSFSSSQFKPSTSQQVLSPYQTSTQQVTLQSQQQNQKTPNFLLVPPNSMNSSLIQITLPPSPTQINQQKNSAMNQQTAPLNLVTGLTSSQNLSSSPPLKSATFPPNNIQDDNKRPEGSEDTDKFKNDWQILQLIGQFNQDAQEAARALIDDQLLPLHQKKYFPINNNMTQQDQVTPFLPHSSIDVQDSKEIYNQIVQTNFEMKQNLEFKIQWKRLNNFIIKIAWVCKEEVQLSDSNNNYNKMQQQQNEDEIQQDSSNNISNDQQIGSIIEQQLRNSTLQDAKRQQQQSYLPQASPITFEVYTNYYGKGLSSEFKALNLINSQHIKHKNDWKYWIKVPLSCLVFYKGFKALVHANSLDEDGLVHGPIFNQERQYEGYKAFSEIENQLQLIGENLGVKTHFFSNGPNSQSNKIFLSFITEVHKSQKFQKIKQMFKGEPDIQDCLVFKQEIYYLKNVGDIFTVNDNYSQVNQTSKSVQFRIEYLKKINKQLNPDAFEDEREDSQKDVQEISQTSLQLQNQYIRQQIQLLDNLEYDVVDSYSLIKSLHSIGINAMYIGYISQNTTIPFIQNITIIDMVARAFKKVLQNTITYLYLESNQWITKNTKTNNNNNSNNDLSTPTQLNQQFQMTRQATFGVPKVNSQLQLSSNNSPSNNQLKEIRIKEAEEMVRDATIDILNLLFGNDDESFQFHQILQQQIAYDFNYNKVIKIHELSKGQLLTSVCFHSQLKLVYSTDLFIDHQNKLIQFQNQQQIYETTQLTSSYNSSNMNINESLSLEIFTHNMILGSYIHSRVFTMDTLSIMKFIEENTIESHYEQDDVDTDKDKNEILSEQAKALQMKIDILKLTKAIQIDTHLFLLSKLSKIYFLRQDYLNAAKVASEAIEASKIQFLSTKTSNYLYSKNLNTNNQTNNNDSQFSSIIIPRCYLVRCMITLVQLNLSGHIPYEYKSKAEFAQQNVMKYIKFLVGDSHPLFFELSQIFINDKIIKQQQQQPHQYSKTIRRVIDSEITGIIQALGINHIKAGERYKSLADYINSCEQDSSQQADCVLYYEKAQVIFSDYILNNKDNSRIRKYLSDVCYSLSFIYLNNNKISQCYNAINVCYKHYYKKCSKISSNSLNSNLMNENIYRLCKLLMMRCMLAKNNKQLSLVVTECEAAWKYYDHFIISRSSLLPFYCDIIKIYINIISQSWSTNIKVQLNELTNKFNSLILNNVNIPDQVRKEIINYNNHTNKSTLGETTQQRDETYSSLRSITQKSRDKDSNSMQFNLLREQKINFIVNLISTSSQEVWRCIEKQFLILSKSNLTSIETIYMNNLNKINFDEGIITTKDPEKEQDYQTVLFFEALIITYGFEYLQNLFFY